VAKYELPMDRHEVAAMLRKLADQIDNAADEPLPSKREVRDRLQLVERQFDGWRQFYERRDVRAQEAAGRQALLSEDDLAPVRALLDSEGLRPDDMFLASIQAVRRGLGLDLEAARDRVSAIRDQDAEAVSGHG
jgi:hypothetical protein